MLDQGLRAKISKEHFQHNQSAGAEKEDKGDASSELDAAFKEA